MVTHLGINIGVEREESMLLECLERNITCYTYQPLSDPITLNKNTIAHVSKSFDFGV